MKKEQGETSGRMSKSFAHDVLGAPHMYDQSTIDKAIAYLTKHDPLECHRCHAAIRPLDPISTVSIEVLHESWKRDEKHEETKYVLCNVCTDYIADEVDQKVNPYEEKI